MPSKIRVLDEHTINKIAAGEVIESPASVVKELVENSLDAGATEICIEIGGGGRSLIRITDNGCGMNRDDALLCLERHATSKIKEVEDIATIGTMGFRGEAMPSIASISKFRLLTCPQEGGEATLLIAEGGRILQCGAAVRSPGTTIEVKSLFFNVPVRRKFQKSPSHDANEILKSTTVLALGNPHVKFQLIDNQETKIQTGLSCQKDLMDLLEERICALMGSEFMAGCCKVDIANENYSLRGYVGLPALARLNRTGQYLFINGRAVFSPQISFLVRDAYGTLLPSNKHPIFVLHLSVPGEFVDVNVHPQKKEVRLRQESAMKDMLLKGVQQAIQKGSNECHPLYAPMLESEPATMQERPIINPGFSMCSREEQALIKEYVPPQPMIRTTPSILQPSPSLFPAPPAENRAFPRVLNTIPSYIILDALTLEDWKAVPQDGLCLLDQKAAHARVIFENLQQNPGRVAVQFLLIPQPVNVPPHEASLVRMHLDHLIAAGIHIHETGPSNFLVDAIPEVLGNVDVGKLILDLLDHAGEFQGKNALENEIQRQVAFSASEAAVNSYRRLQIEEAQMLVNRLFRCKTPFLCPHGKPTLSYLGPEELMKKFQKANA
jgi:DNA mismatch repair protein MutL